MKFQSKFKISLSNFNAGTRFGGYHFFPTMPDPQESLDIALYGVQKVTNVTNVVDLTNVTLFYDFPDPEF